MLDYQAPRPKYKESPEEVSWRLRRLVYYGAHLLLFALIIYRVGPNLFLFNSPFSPTPADYALVTAEYAPTVAALKAYQKDHGELPPTSDNLRPAYMPDRQEWRLGSIMGGTITFQVGSHTVLEYDFRPATEGWVIYAPRYYGRVPAPLVLAALVPATGPSTTRSTDGTR